jgi:protein SCO1
MTGMQAPIKTVLRWARSHPPAHWGRTHGVASFAARWVLALILSVSLAACQREGSSAGPAAGAAKGFAAIDITGANYANQLDLTDTDGKRRSLADFKGKFTLVFFGFTQCPDVCPTTLAEMAQVKKALGAEGARVQVVFVTVDPERDTAERLKDYVGHFGADVVALRGSLEETKATAKVFKVFYAKVPGKTAGSYTMDHTAGTYVFDAQGRIRLFTRHGTGAAALEADLRRLLAEKS